eukprot:NODE_661_length_4933_cov_0.690112.p1 type:complete len:796 gc:universal NODE_661_length_4933_cov_0.690112:3467-1080(-)
MSLDFKDKVVIITGAGGGLGRVYALEYAKRGAKVVVNDLGAAEKVVDEIKAAGGMAVADKHSCEQGSEIVQTALNAFGKVDILINNAGILRDTSFLKMSPQKWQQVLDVHLNGSWKMTKACWDLFNKQKFGRIINTASAAGIYGNYGQSNYSAAKLGLHGMTLSLSKEGERNNVLCNTIAPIAKSRMTESVLPPEILENLKPEFVAPLVLYLTHPSTSENGGLFEVGAGYVAKVRWERAKGAIFKTDTTFTPNSVLAKWDQIHDFSEPQFPSSMADTNPMPYLEAAKNLPSNPQGPKIDLKNKVVVVTGAGNGLGKQYALLFAKNGAKVVVNDLGGSTFGGGQSSKAADQVVAEIKQMGGTAVANYDSVENGGSIIKTAIENFGRIDILVNNAGILRDKSVAKMTQEDWDIIQKVHLNGTFSTTNAAWPYFVKQKYGRVINTSSAIALYGNFGSVNYGAAKSAIIGLSNTLSIEGKSKNITVNVVVPTAGTRITSTIMPKEVVDALKPDYVAPFVVAITSTDTTGKIYEVGAGFIGNVKWQRTKGHGFKTEVKPEMIAQKWSKISDFSKATNPSSVQESYQEIFANFMEKDNNDVEKEASANVSFEYDFNYTIKDVILFHVGLNATAKELNLVYESSDNFTVLPVFANNPVVQAASLFPFEKVVNNYSLANLVHGEQFIQLLKPLSSEAKLHFKASLNEVVDLGKHAKVVLNVDGFEKTEHVIHGEILLFIKNAGGKGSKNAKDRGLATKQYKIPNRAPDHTVKEKTTKDQAALFRLSGDVNPLHIDPQCNIIFI